MRILALDTSTPTTCCALLDDDRVVREQRIDPPAKAGDVLPAALGDLTGVDAVAVGLGPGSFTGLRVGLAAAKAIAYARRIPIAGASSLAAIALGQPGLVVAATEARKGELFAQAFRDGSPQGAVQFMRVFPQSVTIFVLPPSAEVLLERLRMRKTESAQELADRLQSALQELQSVDEYEYVVVNDDLDDAIKRIGSIIDAEVSSRERVVGLRTQVALLIDQLEREIESRTKTEGKKKK